MLAAANVTAAIREILFAHGRLLSDKHAGIGSSDFGAHMRAARIEGGMLATRGSCNGLACCQKLRLNSNARAEPH